MPILTKPRNLVPTKINESTVSTNPLFQQLIARLSALEEQSKIQQNRIAELESRDLAQQKQDKIQQIRIAELESRDLAQQKQDKVQLIRIAELESRDLAQQKQDKIQQNRIVGLESRDRAQQKIISDLEAAIRNEQQQMEELNRSLTETNKAYHYLQEALDASNEDIRENKIDEHNEDSSKDDNRILARRQQPEVDIVAFTAVLVHARNDLGLSQNVLFDHVETNIGNAYNPHHGVFTAPITGTYVFHVTVIAYNSAETWCKIVVNGVNKVSIFAKGETGHFDQGSQTLIVTLNQGDDVAIQNARVHDGVYGDADNWTTFSGFLLRSDAEVTTIVG